MLADAATDPDMRALAESREAGARERAAKTLAQKIRLALIPKDAMDERNVILEIRGGTGGDEAALFAGDLFRMYERYAARHRWKVEVMSASEGTHGRLQGNRRRDQRARRLRQAEVRIRRAPGAARARHRGVGPHPHLGRDRRGAARGRGCRRHDQRRRPQGRHLARRRRRRPARQQDQIRDPPDALADRHRGDDAGGSLAAPQSRQGDGRAAHPALRPSSARSWIPRAPPRAAARSARATVPNASAPTTSRRARVSDHRINLTLYKLPQIMEGEALGEIIDALVTEHQAELLAAEDA